MLLPVAFWSSLLAARALRVPLRLAFVVYFARSLGRWCPYTRSDRPAFRTNGCSRPLSSKSINRPLSVCIMSLEYAHHHVRTILGLASLRSVVVVTALREPSTWVASASLCFDAVPRTHSHRPRTTSVSTSKELLSVFEPYDVVNLVTRSGSYPSASHSDKDRCHE